LLSYFKQEAWMHGRYTDAKYIYDDLSAAWFHLKGYHVYKISRPGMCDVIAWHPVRKTFALCEVKSPNERYAHWSYVTEHNVQGMTRTDVMDKIRHAPGYVGNAGLWKLYAFTLSSQLYNYFKQVDEHIKAAGRLDEGLQGITHRTVKVMAYLAAPVENERIVRQVVRFFKDQGWIKRVRHYRNEALIVTAVYYE
jgi:hypothetical protein